MKSNTILLTLLIVLLGCEEASIYSTDTSSVKLGFQSEGDLFECYPGDDIRLEGASMRWDVSYASKQLRSCTKELAVGGLVGMERMSFKMKSDSGNHVWLQVGEASGEGFYKVITPSSSWKTVDIKLSDLKLNEDKVESGKLEVDQIAKISLIDASGLGGQASGTRMVWISDWEFKGAGSVETTPVLDTGRNLGPAIPVKKLTTGKIGVTSIPLNWQDTDENWLRVFATAKTLGVQLLSGGNIPWSEETEPSPGVYNWSTMERFFSVMDKHGFDFEFSCDMGAVFFHDKIQSPKDIKFKSFTDPVFVNRYKAWMTDYLNRFGDKTNYIVIHAEGAYAYFDKYPDQLQDYLQFVSEVKDLIKNRSPHILFGFNADALSSDELILKLSRVVEFMGFDILRTDHIKDPVDVEKEIKRLIKLSGGKKIAIQNGGWSTSEVEESSDEEQVRFIREFFRIIHKYQYQIEYAAFFTLFDDDISITTPIYRGMFPDYPNDFLSKMVESLGHFGVLTADGNPKPGWNELKKQISQYYSKQRTSRRF